MRMFTDRGVAALQCPVGKDRKYFPDRGPGSVRGLNLMVTAKGARSWVWRARHIVTGKPMKKTLGPYPAFGLANARDWAMSQNLARGQGYDFDERQTEEEAARKAEELAAEAAKERTLQWYWDAHYVPTFIPDKNGNETARLIEKHVLPMLGETLLADITHDDLDELVGEFADTAPGSAERLMNNLKTLFRRAKRDHRRQTKMTSSPAEDLVLPKREIAERDRYLKESEIVYFYRALSRAEGGIRIHAECLDLVLDVGARISEGRKLSFDEIDFDEGIWELPRSRSKNKKAHLMRLPFETLQRIKAKLARKKQRWVFESPTIPGQPYNSVSKAHTGFRKLMAEIAKADGCVIASWSPHDLRRTFKSHLYKAASNSQHPLVIHSNIDRAQNHRTGSKMGARYDKTEYLNEKAAVYRYWQDFLLKLRARAAADERKSAARRTVSR